MENLSLEQFVCPNCQSSDFEVLNDTVKCKYCLSKFTKKQMDSQMFVDLRLANFERNQANFEKAKSIYNDIIKNYEKEDLTDVYWGLFLCEQRVLFEEDGKGEKFPSFFRINQDQKVEDSHTFGKALSCALKHNKDRLEIFNSLAEKIEDVRKMYLDIQEKTQPYDIFICFKNSDFNGNLTQDRELAMDIYNEFSDKYNIFFSEKTLKNIKSNYREYEPNIYYGLYTSKVMLLLCSRKEFLESQWLKNEWSRFTQINKQGQNNKCIIPIFMDGFDPNDLPDELWHKQGIFDNRKLMSTLSTQLEEIINPIDKIAELKKQQAEELEKQKEEIIRQQEIKNKEQEAKIKQLEEMLRIEQEKRITETEEQAKERLKQQEMNAEVKIALRKDRIEKAIERLKSKQSNGEKGVLVLNPTNDRVLFGMYPINKKKEELISWRIIDADVDSVKLCADKILDCYIFDHKRDDYAESDLRIWLKDVFFEKAFSIDEQDHIVRTDTIFGKLGVQLLTQEDAEFLKPFNCEREATPYAIKKGVKVEKKKAYKNKGAYWIMSSPTKTSYTLTISHFGMVVQTRILDKHTGVVPVVSVKF
ncbi:MAG: TIR domain-containing protein [Clostridia bacterium]|nr:TIR domain-containing protein [Clostridia bacterium]